jgi:CBS domain-containing protein
MKGSASGTIENSIHTTSAMKARDLMTEPVVTVGRETTVAEIARIMAEHRIGCVVVVERHGKLCGIVTQTDFFADEHGAPFSTEVLMQMFSQGELPEATERARKRARVTTAEQIMTTEVITGGEDAPTKEMARLMLRYDIDHIPVVRDGLPVGMVARHDFLRTIAEESKPD